MTPAPHVVHVTNIRYIDAVSQLTLWITTTVPLQLEATHGTQQYPVSIVLHVSEQTDIEKIVAKENY